MSAICLLASTLWTSKLVWVELGEWKHCVQLAKNCFWRQTRVLNLGEYIE